MKKTTAIYVMVTSVVLCGLSLIQKADLSRMSMLYYTALVLTVVAGIAHVIFMNRLGFPEPSRIFGFRFRLTLYILFGSVLISFLLYRLLNLDMTFLTFIIPFFLPYIIWHCFLLFSMRQANIILPFILLIISGKLNGQEANEKAPSKAYFKLYAGYGFLTPGSYTVSSESLINSVEKKTEAPKGLGHTLRIGGGIGIIETDFLNLGLDVELMMKNEIENGHTTMLDALNFITVNNKMSYSIVSFTPHAVFKALAKPKFFIYNKLGVLVTLPFTLHTSGNRNASFSLVLDPFNGTVYNDVYTDAIWKIHDTGQSTFSTDYKVSLGIGVNVAFGINYRINDKLRIFGEIFGNYIGLSPGSSHSKTYQLQHSLITVDSNNFHREYPEDFESLTEYTTKYKKSGDISFNGPVWTARKYTITMSSIGINVGIVRRFR